MLLHVAMRAAAASPTSHAVILTQRERLVASAPRVNLDALSAVDAEALNRVGFKYITCAADVCDYLVSIHTTPPHSLPSAICVDNLHELVPPTHLADSARLIALLASAVEWLRTGPAGLTNAHFCVAETAASWRDLPGNDRWVGVDVRVSLCPDAPPHPLKHASPPPSPGIGADAGGERVEMAPVCSVSVVRPLRSVVGASRADKPVALCTFTIAIGSDEVRLVLPRGRDDEMEVE